MVNSGRALTQPDVPTIVIQPRHGRVGLRISELWKYRELLYFLAWRDIKVRYKQTALGVLWAVLQPVSTMIIFSVFFGRLAGIPSDGVPYPIFVYTALLPWQLFAHSLTMSSESVVGSSALITKVYFPRLAIPVASILGGLVDFAISSAVLVALMLYFGIVPGPRVVLLPVFAALAVVSALGVGLWLSALNVKYRDVRYVIPFLTQAWLFVSPVSYPSSLVPGAWQALYAINPMAGVIDGFRWALLGTPFPAAMWISGGLAVVALLGGIAYFQRTERSFAELL